MFPRIKKIEIDLEVELDCGDNFIGEEVKFFRNSLNVTMTVDQGLWRPGLILLTTLSLVATQVLNVQRCGDPHCNGKYKS